LGLMTSDDQLLTDLELSIVKSATPHDANPFDRLRSLPGVGKIFALVRLYAVHDIRRFPRVRDFVSYGRLVNCAKESAGKRLGPSGQKLGKAPLTWAFSAAAGVCRRPHPAGPKPRARVAPKPGQGPARTLLAHQRARAISDLLKGQTALAMATCLQGAGSRAGAPAAALDTHGLSLSPAGATAGLPAAGHAQGRSGLVSRRLEPLLGPPRWLLKTWREAHR
jgi:hypothetical protein